MRLGAYDLRLVLTWIFPFVLGAGMLAVYLALAEVRASVMALAEVNPGAAAAMAGAAVSRVAEKALPLVAVAVTAPAVALDRDQGTDELVRAVAPWPVTVACRRLVVGWVVFLAAAPLSLWLLQAATGIAFNLVRPVELGLVPAVFLAGVAAVTAVAARSQAVGLAGAMVFWTLEVFRPGFLGQVPLFQSTCGPVGCGGSGTTAGYAGGALLVMALCLYTWTGRR